MKIPRAVAIGLLAATAVAAQVVMDDPRVIAHARKALDNFPEQPVECEVSPLKPWFDFSLRLQTGYVGRVPLNPSWAGGKWVVLTRITSLEGDRDPVYLSSVVPIPSGAGAGMTAEVSGRYWIGEGRYFVEWLLVDSGGHGCRKQWRIDARLTPGERALGPVLAPHEVAGVSWRARSRAEGRKAAGRLTILLDAAPTSERSDVLSASDRSLLLDAVSVLAEELPADSVRLVVFQLAQQKEVLRLDRFTGQAVPEVAGALNGLQSAVIDYRALRNPRGPQDFLENLVQSEIRSPAPADAVIFVGPRVASGGGVSPHAFSGCGERPRFFYLQYVRPPFGLPGAPPEAEMPDDGSYGFEAETESWPGDPAANPGPDSIEHIVHRLRGRTLTADSPESFAKAVAEIRRLLAAER